MARSAFDPHAELAMFNIQIMSSLLPFTSSSLLNCCPSTLITLYLLRYVLSFKLHPTSTTPTLTTILTILRTSDSNVFAAARHNRLRFTKFLRSETSNVGPGARIDDSKQPPQILVAGTNIVCAPLETPSACDITRQGPDSQLIVFPFVCSIA
ncbi:hypothetical protein NA56DRAFT_712453 [Hyaloscypha hepaticicola]|uniref:Uncharacterized protein n=1 Tax=Hyaloscypha hepaticicola TaxID=2082293 RepID=A0A2J6PG36_9HELO|nr:hypothetical protein NA56DRAFT_712453 [Hyaloscypha hepaticicola]